MARVAFKELTVGNEVPDSTALALLPVPDDIEPGTRVFNSDIGHNFSYTISTAALDPDVVVEVFGIEGARWILDTSDSEVASVTALPDGGITVDNTDPQNPVLSLSDDTGGTLAEIYAAGLAGTPATDNKLVGTKYSMYMDGVAAGITTIQTTASNGSDFDATPASVLQRDFTSGGIVGLTQEHIQRYSGGADENNNGGSQERWALLNTANTKNTYAEHQVITSIPLTGTSPGYSPGLNNAYDGPLSYERWFLLNRIGSGGTSANYHSSDGILWRQVMTPKNGGAGGPYTIFADQISLKPIDGSIFATPEDGTRLRQGVVGIGDGPANGVFIGGTDICQVSSNYGGAEVEGRYDIKVGSAAGTIKNPVSFSATSLGLVDRVSAALNCVTGTSHVVIPIATGINAPPGTRFLPVYAFVEFTAVDTLTVGPTIELGNNAGEDNVAPALAVANTVVTDSVVPFVMSATPSIITLTTTAITAHFTVNATATTATARIHIIGVYV